MSVDYAANSQKMNYEQFLIASLLYGDDLSEKSLAEAVLMGQAIRNRGNLPTRQFGNSVWDILNDGNVIVVMPEGIDENWQKALQAAGNIAGFVPAGYSLIDAYEGGMTGAMNPVNSEATINIENTVFHKEKRDGFNFGGVTPETIQLRLIKESYTNFLLAMATYGLARFKKLSIKQSITQVFRNIQARPLVSKSIIEILEETVDNLEFPNPLDEDFKTSIQAVGSLVGTGFETQDANGFEIPNGSLKLKGYELRRIEIEDAKFFEIESKTGEIVV